MVSLMPCQRTSIAALFAFVSQEKDALTALEKEYEAEDYLVLGQISGQSQPARASKSSHVHLLTMGQ